MNAVIANADIGPDECIDVVPKDAGHATVFPFVHRGSSSQQPAAGQVLSSQELLSVYAVMAYIAHDNNVRQELIQAMVEAEFSVEHIAKIPQHHLQNVMAFLMDLRMEEIRSRK